MSSTDTNPRFSRSSARPPQSPMGPRLRGPRSPNSPESNPRDSASTPSPINLLVTPLPAVSEKPAQTPPPSPKPLVTTPKATPKRPMLSPPPTLNFDTVPVQWKGLPLEAALWTFNSQELQELVSRAIRLTARESFIRLLSLENLDRALPAEVERLHAMKSSTQSKYRFLVHRRTMLLQALNSSADSASNNSSATLNNKDKDGGVVSQLAMQLAQTTAECDRVLEELLRIGDHLSQIERMVDLHWASALAVALRKLNKSYARRTSDLLEARGRIEQLEAERDDAWQEAERIAKEMDDFTMTEFDIEEAVIGKAEKVSLPNSPSPPTSTFGAIMQVDPLPVFTPLSPVPLPSFMRTPLTEKGGNVPLNFPTPTQHQTQPQPQIQTVFRPQSQPQNPPKDTTDTASIRSTKSMCARSADGTPTTQLNLVTSARKRSLRASKGSLRLPRTHSRSHSRTGTPHPHDQGQDEGDHPPVPDIPLEFSVAPPFPASPSPKPSSNIVWPGSSAHSQTSLGRPSHLRTHSRRLSASSGRYRKTSLDDITPPQTSLIRERQRGRERRDSSSSYAPTVTVDDIHVPPPSYHGHDEIQVVSRTPTFVLPPVPVLHSPKRKPSNPWSSVDPRKRLSQSVDAALAAVAVRLSPTSTPLPPSPLTPSSFNTDMTERGRDRKREREGREGGNQLFSSAGIPSMWLNADSRPNHREQGDHEWGRGMTASPPRGRGDEYEGEEEREEHMDGIGNGIGIGSGFRNGNGIGNGNGNSTGMGMGNANARPSVRPYGKLKTLTKRYSLNFPLSMFVDRTRAGTSSGLGSRSGSGSGSGGCRPTSHVSSPN